MFIENYRKSACAFINQSEDTKLRELLNVKPKCKTEDKAKEREAICTCIRSIYFVTAKDV